MSSEERQTLVSVEFVIMGNISTGQALADTQEAIERGLKARNVSSLTFTRLYVKDLGGER